MWGGGFVWLNIDSPVISMFKDDVSLPGSASTIERYLCKTKATKSHTFWPFIGNTQESKQIRSLTPHNNRFL